MSVALASVIAGVVSVGLSGAVTLWSRRTSGPQAHATIVNASTLLLAQLQTRVAALETRVADLEKENQEHEANLERYETLYGPLPVPNRGEAI